MAILPREVLAAVAPHVPEVLVPSDAQRAIAGLAARLPPAFNWLGFECRLGADDPRVDFAGCCEAWTDGHKRLVAALDADPELAGPGPTALVREWTTPGSLLASLSPAVWLEFDFLGAGAPLPFAFLCIDRACANTFRKPLCREPPPPPSTLYALVERGAVLLAGAADHAAPLAAFRRCVEALPPDARALHVAATPHRGHADLRLHFALGSRDLIPWLRRIDWPGECGPVARALALLGDDFRQVGVQLSAGAGLRPTLGLEAYVKHGPSEFPAWSRSFAALADAGVCVPARASALLRWWGYEEVSLPSDRTRVRLDRQFYLKLSLAPGVMTAKGYLAIFPSYVLL